MQRVNIHIPSMAMHGLKHTHKARVDTFGMKYCSNCSTLMLIPHAGPPHPQSNTSLGCVCVCNAHCSRLHMCVCVHATRAAAGRKGAAAAAVAGRLPPFLQVLQNNFVKGRTGVITSRYFAQFSPGRCPMRLCVEETEGSLERRQSLQK